ncbi:MAG: LysM peptidoglycan-binding domain-containing protein [Proteobacteria bacterium]|nr:LysM peptidoglycan-binding domain-containing protein [Pseudomonadota bacterium]
MIIFLAEHIHGDMGRHSRLLGSVFARASLALATLLLLTSAAHADREHVVRQGQTLSRIAHLYGITVGPLAAANRLARASTLRPGQVLNVPARGVVYVRRGQNLSRIARFHRVSVASLAQANGLSADAMLREGQRLLLPGFEAAKKRARAEKRWGRPARPGVANLHRVWSREHIRLRLVDRSGRVRRPALRRLGHLLRARKNRRTKQPHPRLVRLLAQISDHFGGRPLYLVSGYRPPGGYTKKTSRHVAGHAVDFWIRGVSNRKLRDYCRKLHHVGVGYYPRSHFVHLDVRRKNAYWVDWSRPGQAPENNDPKELRLLFARAAGEGEQTLADLAQQAFDALDLREPPEPRAEDDGRPPFDDKPDDIVGS